MDGWNRAGNGRGKERRNRDRTVQDGLMYDTNRRMVWLGLDEQILVVIYYHSD